MEGHDLIAAAFQYFLHGFRLICIHLASQIVKRRFFIFLYRLSCLLVQIVVSFNEIYTNSLAYCSLTFMSATLKMFIENDKEIKEVIPMKTVQISLNSIDKVKSFVNDITKFDYDFDLVSGRYVIDAKSIMGIFSLDLSKRST